MMFGSGTPAAELAHTWDIWTEFQLGGCLALGWECNCAWGLDCLRPLSFLLQLALVLVAEGLPGAFGLYSTTFGAPVGPSNPA